MLRPLLYLSALGLLAGAAPVSFTGPTEVNISSCPITYYGQTYDRVYVNFTSDKTVICFTGFYNPGSGGDCVLINTPAMTSGEFEIFDRWDALEADVHKKVPAIKTTMKCYMDSYVQGNGNSIVMALVNFGSQTAVRLFSAASVDLQAQVNGATVGTLAVNSTNSNVFLDASGCRQSGVLYGYGAVLSSHPETCTSVVCGQTAVLQTSTCGPLERCLGNNICGFDSVCTVTGPAVIDFHGQVNSVEDRCAYSLVSLTNLTVLATFRERRRKDVSFVDSVTLRLDGSDFLLGRGGRVLLNGSVLTLNSSAQLVHGVELSKDQTGVTAKVSLSDITTSVFFDGSTAQIHMEGPAAPPLQGLCRNSSSSLSGLRLSDYSSTSCETQYNDTADSSINCTMATERCKLLKGAPFSTCNDDVDPEPYITACTDTLCTYPAVDGLNCQFLEAYARACSLYSNASLEGWRSKAGCSPEAFCQDRTCIDHEFCGDKMVGGTGCLCRALFASKYRGTDSLGDPTVCRENSASLTLVGCLLEEKDVDYSVLHLNDQNCRGQVDQLTHMVTFSFNSSNCGTVVTANNSQVTYKNTIRVANSSSDIITRQDQFYIDFSCVQTQPDIKFVSFRIKDSSVVQHLVSGPWNYTLTMKSYTDPGLTQAVDSNTKVMLNQKIWVELETDGLDGDAVAMVTDSCWATDQPSSNGSPRYDLIIGGCANAADRTVQVERNGAGTSNHFSFNMFQFSGGSTDIYLHCKLQLCVRKNSCTPTCGARRRRSSRSTSEAEAFISMGWTG
ncbi:alpha-tectorin-like [Parambassis ranga]|uniref:Alpha-tectorin-like n=1 Tax=Parambassis ranga TaxID=210632 RepID=A0A6P7I4J8_9TELE|nr:alpha-tectorin-like [Parambassis ranga]